MSTTMLDSAVSASGLPDILRNVVRAEISRHAWEWYRENSQEVILERKVLFFRLDVRVRDLRIVFEKLFGPNPGR